ncbi:hypothetical protein [Pelagibius sp.]|uniref:hypothetical protein n=1 Tax=Pelagibius sp. TaxID=1931238 RepID=UPI002612C1CD|nr:hypothetical protein [Pelagibius sp.]
MRQFLSAAALAVGLFCGTAAQAGTLPGTGPNPQWSDSQKFEWYLGYMSKATAICSDYAAATELGNLASLSPYGRKGMAVTTGDGFYGAACAGIRKEAADLLSEKDDIGRYLASLYNCDPGGKCLGGSDIASPKHACAESVNKLLSELEVAEGDIRGIHFTSPPPGPTSGAEPDYRARIRLKSCRGSLYVDLTEQCRVQQSYTRGDCEVAGVSGY